MCVRVGMWRGLRRGASTGLGLCADSIFHEVQSQRAQVEGSVCLGFRACTCAIRFIARACGDDDGAGDDGDDGDSFNELVLYGD